MRDNDEPPAGALTLAEAFARFTDPKLLDALRRLEAAGANVPPREVSRPAWMNDGAPSYSTTNPRWREYRRAKQAAGADFGRRLLSGELSAWGREDSPWGPWRAIPADAWTALAVVDEKGGIVRSPKPAAARLYGVVVGPQRQEMAVVRQSSEADSAVAAGRRRNAQDDALRKNRVEAVLATAKTIWPDRGTRPPTTEMVKELARRKKAQDFALDTLRKILSGTYEPATRLGVSLDW